MLRQYQTDEIFALITANESSREIADRLGISHSTVDIFRESLNRAMNMSACERIGIRRLFRDGFPVGAVAMRVKQPRSVVLAVQWLPSDGEQATDAVMRSVGDRGKQDVLYDLIDLDDLQLISHPLFSDLAQRARKALVSIYVENEGKANACYRSGRPVNPGTP